MTKTNTNVLTKSQRMINENVEYNCNGIIYGYNQKTKKFYMESENDSQELHFEFVAQTEQYYDMLAHINYCYCYC